MSDPPPEPPKKVGSLRDRIAAFETKPAASSAPAAPAPGRPLRTWKPKAPDNPPVDAPAAPSTAPSTMTERKASFQSGMSASDARESVQRAGGSLKDRMAALQGRGAFGQPGPPPPPVAEKPRVWKKPIATPGEAHATGDASSSPAAEPERKLSSGDPLAPEGPSTTSSPSDAAPPSQLPTVAEPTIIKPTDDTSPSPDVISTSTKPLEPETVQPQDDETADEEEERQRRAAIAQRMARLGGARLGMGVPMFGGAKHKEEVVEKANSSEADDAPKDTIAVGETKPEQSESLAPTTETDESPVTASMVETKDEEVHESEASAPTTLVTAPTPNPIPMTPSQPLDPSVPVSDAASADVESKSSPVEATSAPAASTDVPTPPPAAPAKPQSIPLPAVPRRAGPPRRKVAPPPAPSAESLPAEDSVQETAEGTDVAAESAADTVPAQMPEHEDAVPLVSPEEGPADDDKFMPGSTTAVVEAPAEPLLLPLPVQSEEHVPSTQGIAEVASTVPIHTEEQEPVEEAQPVEPLSSSSAGEEAESAEDMDADKFIPGSTSAVVEAPAESALAAPVQSEDHPEKLVGDTPTTTTTAHPAEESAAVVPEAAPEQEQPQHSAPLVQNEETEEDEEDRRKRIAERMAKLGGVRFGMPPPPIFNKKPERALPTADFESIEEPTSPPVEKPESNHVDDQGTTNKVEDDPAPVQEDEEDAAPEPTSTSFGIDSPPVALASPAAEDEGVVEDPSVEPPKPEAQPPHIRRTLPPPPPPPLRSDTMSSASYCGNDAEEDDPDTPVEAGEEEDLPLSSPQSAVTATGSDASLQASPHQTFNHRLGDPIIVSDALGDEEENSQAIPSSGSTRAENAAIPSRESAQADPRVLGIYDDDDTDPIDPAFYSPPIRKTSSGSLPLPVLVSPSMPLASAVPRLQETGVEEGVEEASSAISSPVDEEHGQRKSIAARMAKLGGMRFGAPMAVPPKRSLPTQPDMDSETLEATLSHETASEEAQQEQKSSATLTDTPEEDPEEAERARKQAILARIVASGGQGFSMLPQMPTRSAPPLSPPEIVSPVSPVTSNSDFSTGEAVRDPANVVESAETSVPPTESQDAPPPPPRPYRAPPQVKGLSARSPMQPPPPTRPPPPPVLEPAVTSAIDYIAGEGAMQVEPEKIDSPEDEEDDHTSPPDVSTSLSPVSPRSAIPPPLPAGRRSSVLSTRPPVPSAPPLRHPPPRESSMHQGSNESPSDKQHPSQDRSIRSQPSTGFSSRKSTAGSERSTDKAVAPPQRLASLPNNGARPQWELPMIPSGSLDLHDSVVSVSSWSEDDSLDNPRSPPPPPPPPKPAPLPDLDSDQLMALWGSVGTRVLHAALQLAEQSKRAVIGDGSGHGFVLATLDLVPSATKPHGTVYGHLIFSQVGQSLQRRTSDIMEGDIVVLSDTEFKGRKGLAPYHTHAGTAADPLIGVVNEFEPKRSKIRIFQASQHANHYPTIESVSYRLDDMKQGTFKVYRVAQAS